MFAFRRKYLFRFSFWHGSQHLQVVHNPDFLLSLLPHYRQCDDQTRQWLLNQNSRWKETLTVQTAMPLLLPFLDCSVSCIFRTDKLPLKAILWDIWKHCTNYQCGWLAVIFLSVILLSEENLNSFHALFFFCFDNNNPFAIVGWQKQRISDSRFLHTVCI